MKITSLLIANRGEIACRIIRTAKSLGIETVAIFSDADENAQHVQLADKAYWVGSSKSSESYLNIERIINAALSAKVDAIHPGYGFLSENFLFAKACSKKNIIFVGPPAAAIEAMGSKSTAKSIMQQAGVPLIPGYHGSDQSIENLKQQAEIIGYPIILKPAAGGGGKGMRIVENAVELEEAILITQREAINYFADDTLLLEKYLENPRHIEMQIFADNHGNYVHLFERDCSIQRRHQKVVEEAPAPNLSESLRQKIADTAIAAAKTIDYQGAGTVEFLLDKNDNFYFMEMNTRLQVEHPVTEMINGLDLVKWQLKIAENQPLPLNQTDINKNGHAIEVRLYAEDPDNQFLPSTGKLNYLSWPKTNHGVRIDTGFIENDTVSNFYDPMLAKLIVWAEDRETSIKKLKRALIDLKIAGIKTNVNYLKKLINHPAFINAELGTHFIEHYQEQLQQSDHHSNDLFCIAAALFLLLETKEDLIADNDPHSPWKKCDGWRTNLSAKLQFQFKIKHEIQHIQMIFNEQTLTVNINDNTYEISFYTLQHSQLSATIDQEMSKFWINRVNKTLTVFLDGEQKIIQSFDAHDSLDDSDKAGLMTAPMPGTVVQIFVAIGDTVHQGDKLMTIEAMKMEHSIYASTDGTVADILFAIGQMVEEGNELIRLNSNEEMENS